MVHMNLQEQYTVHTMNKQHINKQWCGSTDYILHTVLLVSMYMEVVMLDCM